LVPVGLDQIFSVLKILDRLHCGDGRGKKKELSIL